MGPHKSLPPPSASANAAGTDECCMSRVRAGDLHAFVPLYDRHHHQARAAAVTLAGGHRADDLTAEAFARLLILLLDGDHPGRAVRYYLYSAVRESYWHRVARNTGHTRPAPTLAPLPDDWRAQLRSLAAEHLEAEQNTPDDPPGLCRAVEIVLRIARV